MGDREQRIRDEAYLLWVDAGRPEGEAKKHWYEAEKRLSVENGAVDEKRPATKRGKSAVVVARNAGNGAVATPLHKPQAKSKKAEADVKKPEARSSTAAEPSRGRKGDVVDVGPAKRARRPRHANDA